MPEMNLRQALAKGLREALDTNDNVFLIGEDIGMYGGPYAVTKDLFKDCLLYTSPSPRDRG